MKLPSSLLAVLLVGCAPPANDANPSTPTAPVAEPDPGSAASAFSPDPSKPLTDCTKTKVERTISWACGEHLIVLAHHPNGLPAAPRRQYQGGEPAISMVSLDVQGTTVQAQIEHQPVLEREPRHIVVVAPFPGRKQVASCSLKPRSQAAEADLLSWCVAAMTAAFELPPLPAPSSP